MVIIKFNSLFMVIVVLPRVEEKRNVIAGMVHNGVHHDIQKPNSNSHRMTLADGRPNEDRDLIAQDKLQRMAVHDGPCHRRGPLVVDLVDVLVPESGMQKAMAVVESHFPGHDTDRKVPQEHVDRGQLPNVGHFEGHLAHVLGQVGERNSVHELVEGDTCH